MKKALKITALVLFLVFVAIQFYRPDMTNPPVIAAQTLEATTEVPESEFFTRPKLPFLRPILKGEIINTSSDGSEQLFAVAGFAAMFD